MNDEELKRVLAEWGAPEPPAELRKRALRARKVWRIPSHIRVPTPVVAVVLAAMLALGFFALRRPPEEPAPASLASFEPAEDSNLRVVRLPDEND